MAGSPRKSSGKGSASAEPSEEPTAGLCPLLAQLLSGVGGELTALDAATGKSFLLTGERRDLPGAPFAQLGVNAVQRVTRGEYVMLNGYQYFFVKPFRATFRRLINSVPLAAQSSELVWVLTAQTPFGIQCFVGKLPVDVIDLALTILPSSLEADSELKARDARELGRKVGHAAKDMAALRGATLSPEMLVLLEEAGEEHAYQAVEKKAVLPNWSIDDLHTQGFSPGIAYLAITLRRMLNVRPTASPLHRRTFVTLVPRLFAEILDSGDVEEAQHRADELCKSLRHYADARRAFGTRLVECVRRAAWRRSHGPFGHAREIEAILSEGDSWQQAKERLSLPFRSKNPEPDTLGETPERTMKLLADLNRVGPTVDAARGRFLVDRMGMSGLELGNWVRQAEGERLVQLVSVAFADLESILGTWICDFIREGNLALALGARGSGRGCATYEPGLTVINLTKTKGDGSLAHEFGHFVDHMLGRRYPIAGKRYFSERATKSTWPSDSIGQAMAKVMQIVMQAEVREAVTGDVRPSRWFASGWIRNALKANQGDLQAAYQQLAASYRRQFIDGRNARDQSVKLVSSMAKHLGVPVEVVITYVASSNYLSEAKKLTSYWHRPYELFARAFECYVEDELHRESRLSEYLVSGTTRDFSRCRALPYHVGEERQRINAAIGELISVLATDRSR